MLQSIFIDFLQFLDIAQVLLRNDVGSQAVAKYHCFFGSLMDFFINELDMIRFDSE